MLPGSAYSLRIEQALDSPPRISEVTAGLEEQAGSVWRPQGERQWKVYGGSAAAHLAESLGWRQNFQVDYLGRKDQHGSNRAQPWLTVDQAKKILREEPDGALLVESKEGLIGLVDAASGDLFSRLEKRALADVRIEPLTNDLLDREGGRIEDLIQQMGVLTNGRPIAQLRLQHPEKTGFGFVARDPLTGWIIGMAAALRGDDMGERVGARTVYLSYNVVEENGWRSRGVGRLLMERVFHAAAVAQPPVLEVIWESFLDPGTRRFYKRVGAREIDRSKSQFARAALIANHVAFSMPIRSLAGLEEVQEFASVSAFRKAHREEIQNSKKLGSEIRVLHERSRSGLRMKAWFVPYAIKPPGSVLQRVNVYVRSSKAQEQLDWETKVELRLNQEGKEHLERVLFLVNPNREETDDGLPTVVIREEGSVLPPGYHKLWPIVVLENLKEVERLIPSWVYWLALQKNLGGATIGPVIEVIPMKEGLAIFV